MLRIREANADRLVDEEDVGMVVPRVWVWFGAVRTRNAAWAWIYLCEYRIIAVSHSPPTELHEETHSGRGTRTAVGPEDDVVRVGVPAALKEVEEEMTGLNIYVPGVRSKLTIDQCDSRAGEWQDLLNITVAELRLFDAHVVLGERRMGERRELGRR